MKVTIIRGPVYSQISASPQGILSSFKDDLVYNVPNYFYTEFYKKQWKRSLEDPDVVPWDGTIKLVSKAGKFRTGLLPRVTHLFEEEGCTCHIKDMMKYTEPEEFSPRLKKKTLRKFQPKAVDAMIQYRYGIIQAPARSGKTLLACELFRRTSLTPFIFLVWRLDVFMQAIKEFQENLPGLSVGRIGGGDFSIGDVTIAMVPSLASAFDFSKLAKKRARARGDDVVPTSPQKEQIKQLWTSSRVRFWDEVHHVASTSGERLSKIPSPLEFNVGITATPYRGDGSGIMLENYIGPLLYNLDSKTALKEGIIAKPKIYIYYLPPPDLVSSNYHAAYEECIVDNSLLHKTILKVVEGLRKSKKTCAIIVRRIDHGEKLRNIIPDSVWLHGEDSKELREEVLQGLNDKKIDCLISTLLDEGVNIPSLDAVIIAEGGKSPVKVFQRMRSLTKNAGKKFGIVVDFVITHSSYIEKHGKARVRMYKNLDVADVIERCVGYARPPRIVQRSHRAGNSEIYSVV